MTKPNTRSTWWWCLCLICCVVCVQFEGCVGLGSKRTDEAYVTLLYGDEFLLGVRVLGKSIRNTRSNKDMVVLVSDGVSDYAKNLLQVITPIIFTLLSSQINDGNSSKFKIFELYFVNKKKLNFYLTVDMSIFF